MVIDWLINPLECFFGIVDHVAQERNPKLYTLSYSTLISDHSEI